MQSGPKPFDRITLGQALGALLGVGSARDALAAVSRYYPSQRLPPKTRFGIEEIFARPVDEP